MKLFGTTNSLNYSSIITLVMVLTLLANLLMLPVFVGLDYDISGVESNVVYTIQSILHDNSRLYANPEAVPFSVTQYAPLYYMIADGVISVLNIHPEQDLTIRVIGRSISVLITLILFLAFFRILKKEVKASGQEALVLALTIVAFTVPWYYLTRPDVLVALFYLLFIWATFRYIARPGFMPAFWMGFLAILAFASKQNGLFLVGMGGLFFLYYKDFKGLLFGFIGFVTAAGLFGLIYEAAGYEWAYFFSNAFDGVNNGIGARSFLEKAVLTFLSTFGFYLVGTIFIGFSLFTQKNKMGKKAFFTAWFSILIFLFATLTATKKGSSVNYYNEFLLSSLLLWGFYIQQLKRGGFTIPWPRVASMFIIFCAFFASTYHMRQYFFTNVKEWTTTNEPLEQVADLMKEEVGDSYFYSTIRQLNVKVPDHALFPQFDIVECCAYPRGLYQYGEFCQMIDKGNLKFLIFESQVPAEIYGCNIEGQYTKYRQVGHYQIYKVNQ